MDRFKLEDVDSEYDVVEPMRASSFDMSFTLSSYRTHNGLDAAVAAAAAFGRGDADADAAGGDNQREGDARGTNPNWRSSSRGLGVLDGKGRLHADDMAGGDENALAMSGQPRNNTAAARRDAAEIAVKLDEKAQEAVAMASLHGPVSWRLVKRMQDVHVYRPEGLVGEEASKLYFRVSCEVRANLPTIMEYLAPTDTRSYFDIESQVFPGLLHASVIKRMELPHSKSGGNDEASNNSNNNEGGDDDGNARGPFPHLQVKWHASRFAGRFVKPVDFFFVEYANMDTLEDGTPRGFSYVRSVESFKGDELASRLNKEDVAIPQSVSKCKRAVINKGICIVTPSKASGGATSNAMSGSYEMTFMMVIDFQQQFPSSVGQKIIHNFTERLLGVRELLYKTLFQPIEILPRELWKSARMNKCAICHSFFSLVRKLHHCRACGEAVCGQCSRRWMLQPGTRAKVNSNASIGPTSAIQTSSPPLAALASSVVGVSSTSSTKTDSRTRLCTSCSLRARSQIVGEPMPFASPPRFSQSHGATPRMRSALSNAAAAATSTMISSLMGSSATNVPRLANIRECDVKVSSAVSLDPETFTASAMAFAELVTSLGDQEPHLMMVSYSEHHDGAAVYEALARAAPNTLFMGGTSSAGVYGHRDSYVDNNFGHYARSSSSSGTGGVLGGSGSIPIHGPALGLWGIYDPEGSFAVLNADLMMENPRDAARRCLLDGMGMLCMEPEDQPDFVWMSMSTGLDTGTEETVVRAVNEIVDCSYSIVGGSSSRSGGGYSGGSAAARSVSSGQRVPSAVSGLASRSPVATQICSEGGSVGCVTTLGACFAICSPSVEVTHAMFTCYEPTDKSFVATQASGRELQALDLKPAFSALNEACHGMLSEFASRPERYSLESTHLPLYYPLAREPRKDASAAARLFRTQLKSSRHHVLQPEEATRDQTLHLGAEVRLGERLRMMSITPQHVGPKIKAGFRDALKTSLPVLDPQDIAGCLMTVSVNYDRILQGDLRSAVADTAARCFPLGALLASVSHGQQGVLPGAGEAAHANGMVSALLITSRKKTHKLSPLRPLVLRRTSTC